MKKNNRKLWLIFCFSISLLTLNSFTQAQIVPTEPANVISNHYMATYPAPIAILFQTTNVNVQISNAVGKVWDVNLRTEITHQFPVDIDMYLTSPQGTHVHFTSSTAGNGYGGGNAGVFNGTWWDDQAATNVEDAVYMPMVLQPSLQPVDALSAFDGENPNGTWTLTITDTFFLDDGSLNAAQLDIATYIGTPTCVTHSYTNTVSTPIPDNASISPTINVSDQPYRISQVKVFTKIPHTASADLDIFLTSPVGTKTTLVTDQGGVNDNIFNGTLWYDEASKSAGSVSNVYTDNVVETQLIPEGALGIFKGENPNGTWTLNVTDDNLNGNVGNLDNWWIEITTCAAGVNDVN
ncbi:MAG: proprotein convertase P-domain-containing protein, partial [Verrucomicrobiae bacterium]|nr:proprotein convertase P-domain-containing protein [Verrucomicrobiae bacterium]